MLRVVVNDEPCFLLPCPAANHKLYGILRGMLHGGVGDIASTPALWQALQKLIDLHPRADGDSWGFPLPEDYTSLADILERLDELNFVEPLPPSSNKSPLPTIPIKSGGDSYLDLFADLSSSFGCESAFLLTRRYGINEINKLVLRSNELAKPHEQRKQEFLAEKHEAWIEKNSDLFRMSLMNPEAMGTLAK